MEIRCHFGPRLIVAGFLLGAVEGAKAQAPPFDGGSVTNIPLDSWSFYDQTNWTDDESNAPISFANLSTSDLGDGFSLVVATNVPAWLNYEIYQPNTGATNLIVNGPGAWSSGMRRKLGKRRYERGRNRAGAIGFN